MQKVRLQKVIASSGKWSRRKAEEAIAAGRVSVNGQIRTEMGIQVVLGDDEVCIDGVLIRPEERKIVLLLNKPRQTVTTRYDPEGRRTVMDLLPAEFHGVKPVGRLDYDTEGLLLLTNDGELANRLAHPRYGIQKEYEALVSGVPNSATLKALTDSVDLKDGPGHFEKVIVANRQGRDAVLRIRVSEGRNRFVRRMLDKVGHPVQRLQRLAYGGLRLENFELEQGEFRILTEKDVSSIFETH